MTRTTTTARAVLVLCAIAFCVGCTENEVIQREARSLEGVSSHARAARGRVTVTPRQVTTRVLGRAAPVAGADRQVRLQLAGLPALDADLLYELRWARHMERSELSEKTKDRFIPAPAKAWGAHYGTYAKAYDAALAMQP